MSTGSSEALIAFRQRRDVVTEGARLSLNDFLMRAQIEWHGVALNRPDWSEQLALARLHAAEACGSVFSCTGCSTPIGSR